MTPARVQIQGGPAFDCAEGDNVLRAALRNGIGFPYECSSGGCGSCQFELLDGEVDALWDAAPGLTEAARKARRHLACQSAARSDVRIKVRTKPQYVPLTPPRRQSARFVKRLALTADMAEYTFESDGPANFLPGQYALIGFAGVQGDRAYSMSNVANDRNQWSFIIKRVPGGSGTEMVEQRLREGDRVSMDGPFGTAFFRRESPRDIVCIGGGSGLSPLKSILTAAVREVGLLRRSITLFYGARTPNDLCADRVLDDDAQMKTRVQLIAAVSDAAQSAGWDGKKGFVHEVVNEWLESGAAPAPAGTEFYFCGPPPMTDAVHRMLLLNWKVPAAQLHFDRFV